MNTNDSYSTAAYKNTAALKADARRSLLGHLGTAVGAMIVYLIAIVALSLLEYGVTTENAILFFVLSLVFSFVIGTCSHMLEIGLCNLFIRYQYGQNALLGDLFSAFRFNSDTNILVSATLSLINLACMLPASIAAAFLPQKGWTAYGLPVAVLFILGLLFMLFFRLRYGMTSFLLLDYPDLSAQEILRGSEKFMRRQMGKLLKLYLSFVPMLLLGMLSLGIANLWVLCYLYAASAAFYRDRISVAAGTGGNR